MKLIVKTFIFIIMPIIIFSLYQVNSYVSFNKELTRIDKEVIIPSLVDIDLVMALQYDAVLAGQYFDNAVMYLIVGDVRNSQKALLAHARLRDERTDILAQLQERAQRFPEASDINSILRVVEQKIRVVKQHTAKASSLIQKPNMTSEELARIASIMMEDILPARETLYFDLNTLLKTYHAIGRSAESVRQVYEVKMLRTFYVQLGIGFFLLVLFIVFINLLIVRPVGRMTQMIDLISKGKIDVKIADLQRADEIGELARSFERTLVSLKLAMKETAPELKKQIAEKKKVEEEKKTKFKKTFYEENNK